MPNIRLVLEYDGRRFKGWQAQPGVRTIETELEKALQMVLRVPVHPIWSAGRTDAGVHARRQVVNFQFESVPNLFRLCHAVSNIMKGDLAVVAADVVPDEFHARHSAIAKQYSYTILNRPMPPVLDKGKVWHVSRPLDIEQLRRDAAVLVGEHDFSSFRGARCSSRTPVKTIYESEIEVAGSYVIYRVVGSGFLKQMVRAIVGTLVYLNRGLLTLKTMQEVLDARSRQLAGVTAPPQGLCMDWVKYQPQFAEPTVPTAEDYEPHLL